jgi:hypothetical protein
LVAGNEVMTFKFKKLKGFCVGWTLIIMMFFAFSCAAASREGIKSAALILAIFMPLLLFAGVSVILNMMDIIVSDRGVSRTFLGVTWQSMDWSNIKVIKLFNIRDGNLGEIVWFNFFPEKVSKFHIIPSGKIVFNDGMTNFQEFRELVNHYIETRNVRVERVINGASVVLNKI